jgi:predicted lactoylglutathione lyase
MKKTATSTGSRTARNAKRQNAESNPQSAKALRTVGDQEAFHFYEAIGKPTGQNAKNLKDFLEKVKTVKAESLAFHLQRKDFQNWAEKILGDAKLARELGRISATNSDDVRMLVSEIVQSRIKELKQSSAGLIVSENSVVYLSAT